MQSPPIALGNDNKVAITEAEVAFLRSLLLSGDRAGFYLAYNSMTGSEGAILTARVSTFSANIGGIAFAANYLAQEQYRGAGPVDEDPYSGIYFLSQEVAERILTVIEADLAADGGTGVIPDIQLLNAAQLAWDSAGNSTQFPFVAMRWFLDVGSLEDLTFLETGVAIGEILNRILFDESVSSLVDKIEELRAEDNLSLTSIIESFADAPQGLLTSPGSIAAVLGIIGGAFFGKRLSDYEGVAGYSVLETADGAYKTVLDVATGKTVAIFDDSLNPLSSLTHAIEVALESVSDELAAFRSQLGWTTASEFLEDLGLPTDAITPFSDWNGDSRRQLSEKAAEFDGDRNPNNENTDLTTPTTQLRDAATEGNDVLWGTSGFLGLFGDDEIDSGAGNDVVFGGEGEDTIRGGDGNDILYGQDDDDQLFGGADDDILRGGSGRDILDGGQGDDILDGGDSHKDLVDVGDILRGGAGNDTLYGGSGNDQLEGGSGADTYYVTDGDTIFDETRDGQVFWGDEQIVGGARTSVNLQPGETVIYRQLRPGGGHFVYLLTGDQLQVYKSETGEFFRISAFESGDLDIFLSEPASPNPVSTLLGTAGDDNLIVNAGDSYDEVLGLAGDDQIQVHPDKTPGIQIDGGSGNDNIQVDVNAIEGSLQAGLGATIEGGPNDDFIVGGHRDDRIRGGLDHDHIVGSLGDDSVSGDSGNNWLEGNEGDDFVIGGNDRDYVLGGAGKDFLLGGSSDDLLYGDASAQTLAGWDGVNFTMTQAVAPVTAGTYGLLKDSTNPGGDTIIAGDGNDFLYGGAGDDTLYGGDGDDRLEGEGDNDRLYGGSGNDFLYGDRSPEQVAADDAVFATGTGIDGPWTILQRYHPAPGNEDGDDTLHGGLDNDWLFGQGGSDTYEFGFGDGEDFVVDSSGTEDKIRFDAGIQESNVRFVADGGALFLLLQDDSGLTDDYIAITDWNNANSRIERIEFADGTTLDTSTSQFDVEDVSITSSGSVTGGGGITTYEASALLDDGFSITLDDGGSLDSLLFRRLLLNTPPELGPQYIVPEFQGSSRDGGDLVLSVLMNSDLAGDDRLGEVRIQNYYTQSGFIETIEVDGVILGAPNTPPVVINQVDFIDREAPIDAPLYIEGRMDEIFQDEYDVLTYGAQLSDGSPLPSWLTFDLANNEWTTVFSGTPTIADEGTWDIDVFAIDKRGLATSIGFSLTVGNGSPTVEDPIPDQFFDGNDVISFQLAPSTFLDPNAADVLTYTALLADGSPLPPWLSFDSGTVTFSGTAPDPFFGEAFDIHVTATDAGGLSATDEFSVVINNVAPFLRNPIPELFVAAGSSFTYQIPFDTFDDPNGEALTIKVQLNDDDGLPEWLSYDPVTQILTGNPTAELNNNIGFLAEVQDRQGLFAFDAFDIWVTPPGGFSGTNQNDYFIGTDANEYITGGFGDDVLLGGGGNDTLDGGRDQDKMVGGDGDNIYLVRPFDGLDEIPLEPLGTHLVRLLGISSLDDVTVRFDRSSTAIDIELNFNEIQTGPNSFSFDGSLRFTNAFVRTSDGIVETGFQYASAYSLEFGDQSVVNVADLFDIANQTPPATQSSSGVRIAPDDGSPFSGTSFNESIYGRVSANQLTGLDGNDSIFGGMSNDLIDGEGGNDELFGRAGDDVLRGGIGSDFLVGGLGNDRLENVSGDTFYQFHPTDGDDVILDEGGFDEIRFEFDDVLQQTPVEFDDLVVRRETNNIVIEYADTDSITVEHWFTSPEFRIEQFRFSLPGGEGGEGTSDFRTADDIESLIVPILPQLNIPLQGQVPVSDQTPLRAGDAFSFAIAAGTFSDLDGPDDLVYEATLSNGNALPEWLFFDPFSQIFSGTPSVGDVDSLDIEVRAIDGVTGNFVADSFAMEVKDPILAVLGTEGDDTLSGQGATPVFGLGGGDLILGSNAADKLFGDAGDDQLAGFDGDDIIHGNAGDDFLTGGTGGDELYGGTGDDDIFAFTGDDLLLGGPGSDLLLGNLGDDRFVFRLGDGVDLIDDGFGDNTVEFQTGIVDDDIVVKYVQRQGSILEFWLAVQYSDTDRVDMRSPFKLDSAGDIVATTPSILMSRDTRYQFANGNVLTQTEVEDRVISLSSPDSDALVGGSGSDFISGGDGNDRLYGGAGDDSLFGDGGDDVAFGGSGDDLLEGGEGNDFLLGYSGDDTLVGGVGNDTLTGNDGNDVLRGGDGDDRLTGGSGDDRFESSPGDTSYILEDFGDNDVIQDAAGFDKVVFDFEDVTINDFVVRRDVDNLVIEYSASDSLTVEQWFTSAGNRIEEFHIVVAGSDGDLFDVFTASDIEALIQNQAPLLSTPIPDTSVTEGQTLTFTVPTGSFTDPDLGDVLTFSAQLTGGGALPAWLSFDPSTQTFSGTPPAGSYGDVNIDVTATDSGSLSVSDSFTLIVLADGTIFGGSGNDKIIGTSGSDVLDGKGGDDTLDGAAGDDTIHGGPGGDTLLGGSGDDVLNGEGGRDILDGGDGDDTLSGGDSMDVLTGGAGNDTLLGGGGDDVLDGGDGDDTLDGGANADVLTGGAGDDTLDGSGGDDILSGGLGNDVLSGGANADLLDGGDGNDTLIGEGGNDVLIGGDGDDSLDGGANADTLTGGAGADTLVGGGGNDILDGGIGNDSLFGNANADTLIGGDGDDVLSGDGGSDTLVGGLGNDLLQGGGENDTYQFERGDGQDIVEESGGGADSIEYGLSITKEQLWFTQDGNDLTVRTVGETDTVTIQDWYVSNGNQVEEFHTADGAVLVEAKVQQLVDAMAAFAPPSGADPDLPQNVEEALEPVFATTWTGGN